MLNLCIEMKPFLTFAFQIGHFSPNVNTQMSQTKFTLNYLYHHQTFLQSAWNTALGATGDDMVFFARSETHGAEDIEAGGALLLPGLLLHLLLLPPAAQFGRALDAEI